MVRILLTIVYIVYMVIERLERVCSFYFLTVDRIVFDRVISQVKMCWIHIPLASYLVEQGLRIHVSATSKVLSQQIMIMKTMTMDVGDPVTEISMGKAKMSKPDIVVILLLFWSEHRLLTVYITITKTFVLHTLTVTPPPQCNMQSRIYIMFFGCTFVSLFAVMWWNDSMVDIFEARYLLSSFDKCIHMYMN